VLALRCVACGCVWLRGVATLRWGSAAKLRPHLDTERTAGLFVIPDPTQTAVNIGVVVRHWRPSVTAS